jgi:acetyltransferase-like isoleucine patch superfamily enzyme
MVKLGQFTVPFYPNSGIVWSNKGGKVVFRGTCSIGNASVLSIEEKGCLDIGDNFCATTSLKLTTSCHITFRNNVLLGWNVLLTDNDWHKLTFIDDNAGQNYKPYLPIEIGANCWIGFDTKILKGACIPDNCVIGANSLLNKKYDCPEYSLLAGQPATVKKSNVYRDRNNDIIDYNC